jgi:hypothetical protein
MTFNVASRFYIGFSNMYLTHTNIMIRTLECVLLEAYNVHVNLTALAYYSGRVGRLLGLRV